MHAKHPSAVRPAGHHHLHFRATALLLAALLTGCNVSQAPLQTHAQSAEDIAVTRNQLRLRMRSMVQPMCAQLEQSADSISSHTTDPAIQMAALQWKLDAIPALRTALFQPDPAIAALDAAVLLNQMIDYFDVGPGHRALGPTGSQAAATTCRQMLDDLVRALAAGTTTGDMSKRAAFARQWAADHPIRFSIADRQSALALAFERGSAAETSALQTLADTATTLDDLNRKVDLYGDQLFRQLRWEVDRFKRELIAQLQSAPTPPLAERTVSSLEQISANLERTSANLDRLAPTVERALAITRDAPSLLTAEREATLKAVHEELTATTRFARDERQAVMDQISKERIAALQAFQNTMTEERERLALDLNQLTVRQIDATSRRVTHLVAFAMTCAFAAAFLALLLARHLFARPRPHKH